LIFGFGAGPATRSALGLAFGSIPGFEFGALRLHGRDGWVPRSSSAICRAPNGPGPAPWGTVPWMARTPPATPWFCPGWGYSRSPTAACSTGDRGQTGVKVAWW